jgi:DNA topoisomerase-1
MSKILIIVESPGKLSKISQILGSNYIIKASFGHITDLDKKTLSIDVENNFKPLYITSPDKVKVVKELKDLAKDCSEVIMASDNDREGEKISESLASVLNIKNPKRIIFHEITKTAIMKAIENPTTINYDIVKAQEARRILDRLVGYKISPVLWKHNPAAKSAGRVQSVVLRIINDKENEIKKSVSEPYIKTVGEFNHNKTKISSVLQYDFKPDQVKPYLELITKKTEFKVISVENKKSIRKPSSPFITSSLQQEASTRLHFSVKKTMDVAQKLYEAGLITYMRSDSPNISEEAIEQSKKYIINTYGKEYSDPKNYQSKNSTSQDAHECIRPTHLDSPEPDIDGDQLRLYSLIWKRTIASQMSNAQVNVQTIQIDAQNNNKSILSHYKAVLENVEFPGYLSVYDNSDSEEKVIGKLEIKVNDILTLSKIKSTEEYTKLPLRYNEASLVKYLEKNGIGRPSTFASIISKVVDREYVEIKNIDGIKQSSKQIELNSKFKIEETIKDITVGKEQKKIVPTEMGIMVNDFMMTNFAPIMDVEFTAKFETYLDKIAIGKANWVTVLRIFYDMFNPIVEKLNTESKVDKLLGIINNVEIYTGIGKFGKYVKIKEDEKWKFAPYNESLTLEQTLELFKFPKKIGKIGNGIITLNKGQYGLYLKYLDKNYAIKETDILKIDIDYARKVIENTDVNQQTSDELLGTINELKIYTGTGKFGQYIKYNEDDKWKYISIKENITIDEATELINNHKSCKSFTIKDKVINIKNGDYGYYLQIVGKKKQNISIPKKYNIENLKLEDVLSIIANKNGLVKK